MLPSTGAFGARSTTTTFIDELASAGARKRSTASEGTAAHRARRLRPLIAPCAAAAAGSGSGAGGSGAVARCKKR